MLARPDAHRCIECGRLYGGDDFSYHYGRIENGPVYWSDRGLLCSVECSLAHTRKRMADGTLPSAPSQNPLEADPPFRR